MSGRELVRADIDALAQALGNALFNAGGNIDRMNARPTTHHALREWLRDYFAATADDIEREARAMFERRTKGWPNVTPWDELSDATRETYRDRIRSRTDAAASAQGVE